MTLEFGDLGESKIFFAYFFLKSNLLVLPRIASPFSQ